MSDSDRLSEIRKRREAAEAYAPTPQSPYAPVLESLGEAREAIRAAFIAGAEWTIEQAARLAYEQQGLHSKYQGTGNCGACACAIVADAIRSLSTTYPIIPISGSSGSDSENTMKEESDG